MIFQLCSGSRSDADTCIQHSQVTNVPSRNRGGSWRKSLRSVHGWGRVTSLGRIPASSSKLYDWAPILYNAQYQYQSLSRLPPRINISCIVAFGREDRSTCMRTIVKRREWKKPREWAAERLGLEFATSLMAVDYVSLQRDLEWEKSILNRLSHQSCLPLSRVQSNLYPLSSASKKPLYLRFGKKL